MYQEIDNRSSNLCHLIIVPGHAPFNDDVQKVPKYFEDDKYWVLNDYQVNEPKYYVEHIYKGLEIAAFDESSLLVFSGGFSRKKARNWSEAKSYSMIAQKKCDECVKTCSVSNRTALDEWALDSFQNLIGGICVFNEITRRKPEKITIIGWKFKEERFDLHRSAIGYPVDRFFYIGINDPDDLQKAMIGENKTKELFQKYPFGTGGELLVKRETRNNNINNYYYKERTNLDKLIDFVNDPKNLTPPNLPIDIDWNN